MVGLLQRAVTCGDAFGPDRGRRDGEFASRSGPRHVPIDVRPVRWIWNGSSAVIIGAINSIAKRYSHWRNIIHYGRYHPPSSVLSAHQTPDDGAVDGRA